MSREKQRKSFQGVLMKSPLESLKSNFVRRVFLVFFVLSGWHFQWWVHFRFKISIQQTTRKFMSKCLKGTEVSETWFEFCPELCFWLFTCEFWWKAHVRFTVKQGTSWAFAKVPKWWEKTGDPLARKPVFSCTAAMTHLPDVSGCQSCFGYGWEQNHWAGKVIFERSVLYASHQTY